MQPSRTDPTAVTPSTPSPRVPRQPGNQGEGVSASTSGRRPMRPQPVRRWLAVLATFVLGTAFALLTAGGAHAQTLTSAALNRDTGGLELVFSGDVSALDTHSRIIIRDGSATAGQVEMDLTQHQTTAGNTVTYTLTPSNLATVLAMADAQLHFALDTLTLAAGGGQPAGQFPRVFDVRDAVYSGVDFNPGITPRAIAFNTDGTRMFLTESNGDTVQRFTLNPGFDLSTATTTGKQSYSVSNAFNTALTFPNKTPSDVAFGMNGTRMFVTSQSDGNVDEFALTTGYDLSAGNITHTRRFEIGSANEPAPRGIAFSNDGMRMFIVGNGDGATNDVVNQISLSSPYDLSSSSVGTFIRSFSFGSHNFNPFDITFNAAGTRMYIARSGFSVGDQVLQYDLANSYTTVSADATNEGILDTNPTQMSISSVAFNTTGDILYTAGTNPNRVHQFNLNHPHTLAITNTRPVVTISNNIATGTVANRADGDITFMLWFSEDVTGFERDDIMITGGALGTISPNDPNPATTYGTANTFTFLVTPTDGINDGMLTIRLNDAAATAGTGRDSVAIDHILMYDTLAPTAPIISAATIAEVAVINAAEETAGITLTGTVESGVDEVRFCFNDGTGTVDACPVLSTTAVSGTTWNLPLTTGTIDLIGEGDAVMRVDAVDSAGNTSTAVSTPIFIDTAPPEAPTFATDIATDLTISAAERDNRVTVRGGNSADTTAVTLCLGAASLTDAACATGVTVTTGITVTGTTWSYRLTVAEVDAMGQGDEILTAIGIDSAGNPSVAGGTTLTVDTIAPLFTSGDRGVVAINSAITVVAYDAQATDNGGDSETADAGVTYDFGGGTDDGLFNIMDAAIGEVRYNDQQPNIADHAIIITATDVAGNATAHNVSIGVRAAPEVEITDSVTSTYTNAAVTFTIRFTEPVTGFEATDVTVTGSSTYTLTETLDAATTYMTTDTFTLVATPLANTNDGTLTVTVAANAVMGTQTSAGNPLATAEQRYDTMNPTLPQEEGLFITNDPPAPALDLNGYDVNGNTDSVTYSFGGGTHDHLFTLDADNGQVRYINTPSGSGNHFIDIIATDKGGNTATRRNLAISFTFRSTVTSVGGVDGFYKENDPVSIFVTFNRAVSVSGTGKPQLTLNTDTTSTSVGTATYSTGTNVLTFIYTVRDGDNTPNLAYTGTDALSAARFGITNSGSIDAILTLPGVGDTNSLSGSSTIVLDTITPVFPAPGDATSDSDPLMLVLATGAADTTEVHNAEATDNGGASETADDGITYALSGTGTDADAFSLTTAGVLTPAASPTAAGTYTLTITATDQAGNAAIQHIRVNVVALPTVNITDTITGTANLADGDITFTISFSGDVTGFESSDLTVTGHTGTPSLSPTPDMATTYGTADPFTLVVTPISGTNSGVLTITVAADAATTTDGTSRMTVGISHEQPYDTLAPVAPTFNPVGTPNDGYLNAAAAAQPSGQLIGGKSDTMVTLCLAGTGGDSCGSGRTTRGTNFISSIGGGRGTWSYLLTTDDITAMDEGAETLTAIATDAAGNPTEASVDIIVDTMVPEIPLFSADAIATDDIINLDERNTGGVTVSGTTATDVTAVTLCAGATDVTDSTCTGGTEYTASVGTLTSGSLPWSYALTTDEITALAVITALGDGTITLTAIATDMAGNPAVSTGSVITVDTTRPMFTSGATGVVGIRATITAYDAQATNNGGASETADEGVTYSLTGGTDVGLFNITPADGMVTYKVAPPLVADHSIIITATDTAGNTNTQTVTISVRVAPEVIITGVTSGYVNGDALTLTFTFSEPITAGEFSKLDIEVESGGNDIKGAFTEITADEHYTVVATPTAATNDGVLTVTVRSGAITRAGSTTGNPATMVTQQYDSENPVLTLSGANYSVDGVTYIIDQSPLQILDADATDGTGTAANVDITYSLTDTATGSGHAALFDITSDGEVSYRNAQTTAATHNISVSATDDVGNTTTVAVIVTVVRRATVTSVVGTEGTFGKGARMSILVTFSENVTVERTGGDPVLELNTGNTSVGTTTFFSSSGNEVFFVYDVRAGDNTSNLVSTSINALTLPTGTTIQTSDGLNAILTLPTGSAALGGTTTTALDGIIPVFPDAAMDADTPLVRTIATDSTVGTLVYDAQATNNGGALETPDDGVTYALDGTQAARFSLDTTTGALTTTMAEPAQATYTLTITATDEATSNPTGTFPNVATQHLRVMVSDVPTATITPIGTGTANIASGALTFTLSFSESVTGFETGDLTFTGGTLNSISQTPVAGDTYTSSDSFTILATPFASTNAGTLTVTLLANAAHSPTDTARLTPIATASRMYDTQAPGEPTFSAASITALEAINRAEENAGVPLNGTVESGVPMVLFCFNDGTGSVSTCTGGLPASTVSIGTTWSFTLTSTSIDTIGEGAATMRVVAADAAGNNSTAVSTPIFIDTVPPATAPRFNLIADDNTINIAERADGVTVSGTTATDVTAVTLCADATDFTDALCVGGTTYTTSVSAPTWSSRLTTADITDDLADGSIALTAIATDMAGNPIVSDIYPITVDTVAPVFAGGATGTGSVAVGSTSATATAYDAAATNNGGDSETADTGVSYSLSGTDVGEFNIVPESGIVTYKTTQTTPVTHTIVITATDTAGNPTTQDVTINVLVAPSVTITDSTTSEYTNAAVTFTIQFSEPVFGFDSSGGSGDDITIVGALATPPPTISPSATPATTYQQTQLFTVTATPAADTNNGDLSVTVVADAVTGTVIMTGNTPFTATQMYDTLAPVLTGDAAVFYLLNDLPVGAEVFDADATDGGGDADAGLTYSLTGTDALSFDIDPANGKVTYKATPTDGDSHNINIVATDKGSNTATHAVAITVANRATVVSVSATDGFYNDGDTVLITVEFDEEVTVTTSPGGTAGLQLRGDTTTPTPAYDSGSGTTSLTFTLLVEPDDNARNLDYRNTTSLFLESGGAIRTRSDTLDADLTLPPVGSAMSLSGTSDVVLDNAAPVFPGTATTSSAPLVRTIAIGSPTSTVVYDANATDSGRTADTGISYELTVDGSGFFAVDTMSGALTPAADSPPLGTYTLTLTATDEADNVATQYLRVVVSDVPTATITPLGSGTANIASGALTFTLSFSESVTGFASGDLTFTGGTLDTITPNPVAGDTYTSTDIFTLLVTPTPNTSGILTVTLLAEAAHSPTDPARLTPVATASRAYDTLATAPAIDAVTSDNIIDATELAAGVTVTGTNEAGASVILCSNPTTATATTCAGGTMYTTTVTTTTWSVALTTTQINALPTGSVTLTAIATDAAGNAAVSPALEISVAGQAAAGVAEEITLPDDEGIAFVTLPTAATLQVSAAPAAAANNPPAGRSFSLTVDITATTFTGDATVCLPTTGVPTGLDAMLYHYSVLTGETDETWNEIGRDTTTRAGHVCGEVATFSPFAVGYDAADRDAQAGFGFANPTVSRLVNAAAFTVTATGGSGVGEITYTSSDTTIADVTNSGLVTIVTDAIGSTTITATKAGDATYNTATDSYILTVFMTHTVALPNDASGNAASGFVTLPVVDTVVVTVPSDAAINNPPTGIEFSLTTDLSLMTTGTAELSAPATVCLTANTPSGSVPILFHYTAGAWNEIGRDTTTRVGFVCGEITTFSPFAVGYQVGGLSILNEQILTRVTQAVAAGTLATVATRVREAGLPRSIGASDTPAFQFGGQSSVRGLLESHAVAILQDEMDYSRLLDGASFVLPLHANADDAPGRDVAGLSLWGNSDYRTLSDDDSIDWDGDVVTAHIGVDGPVNEQMMAGFALAWNKSDFDYDDAGTIGDYRYRSTSLHPYIGWLPHDDVRLWATAGYGIGEVENDTGGTKIATDTKQASLAGGFTGRLLGIAGWLPGGTTTLNMKGDASLVWVDVDDNQDAGVDKQDVDTYRLRWLISGEYGRALSFGGMLTPSVEIGLRYDGGDGENGDGVEFGIGLRYTNPARMINVSGNVRTLLAHNYDEWGADVTVRIAPHSGRGLLLSVNPVWGNTQSAAAQLWDNGASEITEEISGGDAGVRRSLDTEVGYGMDSSMLGLSGMLTPYAGVTAVDGGSGSLRVGSRFAASRGFSLGLEGVRENTLDGGSHRVLLRGEVRF